MATEMQSVSAENTAVSDPTAPPPTIIRSTPETSGVQDTPTMPPLDSNSDSLPAPGATAPAGPHQGASTTTTTTTTTTSKAPTESTTVLPPLPHSQNFRATPSRAKKNGGHPPLTLNQLAIVAASQNKLPTSRVKGIVMRMGRHTQSSAGKLGCWYKNDNYVDNANYSWRNMELFIDYQQQMYTPAGTVKASCKK